jgi:hypothetical protein
MKWGRRQACHGGAFTQEHDGGSDLVWDTSLEVHMLPEEMVVLSLSVLDAVNGLVVVLPEWFMSTVSEALTAPAPATMTATEAVYHANR